MLTVNFQGYDSLKSERPVTIQTCIAAASRSKELQQQARQDLGGQDLVVAIGSTVKECLSFLVWLLFSEIRNGNLHICAYILLKTKYKISQAFKFWDHTRTNKYKERQFYLEADRVVEGAEA